MTHKRPGWYSSVRGTSTRTVGNESGNGEALKNYHMGDGVNLVLIHGDEYREIYPVWDWRRIPGTTIEQKPGDLPRVDWGKGGAGGTDFAGGVSDGKFGAYAFIFAEAGENANISARKSWFFFENEYIALGAGINATNATYDVFTSINQTCLRGDFSVNTAAGRRNLRRGVISDSVSAWVLHNGIGYLLPQFTGSFVVQGKTQTGSWQDLYLIKSAERLRKDVFSIWFNHGQSFSNGSYHYVVKPNTNATQIAKYASNPPVAVIANTETVQAVRQKELDVYGVIFYTAAEVKLNENFTVSSDHPLALLIHAKKDRLQIFAATPEYRALDVSVTISGQYQGPGATWDAVTGKTKIRLALPGGDNAGSTVSVRLVSGKIPVRGKKY